MTEVEQLSAAVFDAVRSYIDREIAAATVKMIGAIPLPVRGEKGDSGPMGEKGQPGEPGARGEPGERGEVGPPGPQGEPGPPGDRGSIGPQGPAGQKGADGLLGPPGPRGEAGLAGKDGAEGKPGPVGERGERGEKGADGVNGKDGAPGQRGERGEKGEPGGFGQKGDPGDRGEDGRDGRDGKDGRDGQDGEPGRDALEIDPLPVIDASRSYPAGTWACHNGALVRAARTTAPLDTGELAVCGWRIIVNGEAENSLDLLPDMRTLVSRRIMADGSVIERSTKLPVMIYRGVHEQGKAYDRGDCVTRDGSIWIAERDTDKAPGGGAADWRLAVKKGADRDRSA